MCAYSVQVSSWQQYTHLCTCVCDVKPVTTASIQLQSKHVLVAEVGLCLGLHNVFRLHSFHLLELVNHIVHDVRPGNELMPVHVRMFSPVWLKQTLVFLLLIWFV